MATKKSNTSARPQPSGKEVSAESKGDLAKVVAELNAQVAALTERLAKLEAVAPAAKAPPSPAAGSGQANGVPKPAAAAPAAPKAAPAPEISEDELLAVSAALAAYFGVRMRIRQIRLVSSQAWAQQGRVSIQASHRLHN